MTLTSERCVACHKDAPRVTDAELPELKAQIPAWEIIEVDGVARLQRQFKRKGWSPAVDFANRVAAAADAEDHHPLIQIEWGKVTVAWWTHAIDGLHRNDFVMAAKTDELFDTA